MVAEVLAHGETHEKARQRMLRALNEFFYLDGIVPDVPAQREYVSEGLCPGNGLRRGFLPSPMGM